MRPWLLLILLAIPANAFASVEIRVQLWPQVNTYPAFTPTHQRWIHRHSPTADSGQRWRRVTRPPAPGPTTTPYDDFLNDSGQSSEHLFRAGLPNYRILRTVSVIATAYNSRRGQTDGTPWRTANSRLVREGDIACNFLPLGTLVRIADGPAQLRGKIFRVEDRLADPPPLGWNQIDIWMLHVSDALAFGKQNLTLQILGDPIGEAPH